MPEEESKWKNYGLWLSIASCIGLILQTFKVVEIDNAKWGEIINLILGILVMAGIISNPSIGTGYKG